MPKLNPRRGSSCATLIGHLLSAVVADDLADDDWIWAETLQEFTSKRMRIEAISKNFMFDNGKREVADVTLGKVIMILLRFLFRTSPPRA